MVGRSRSLAVLSLALASLVLGGGRIPSSQPTTQPAPHAEIESRIVGYTNTYRKKNDRGVLATDDRLTAAAREFATYIAEHDNMAHNADGHEPSDRVRAQGYEPLLVGENLAWFATSGTETDSRLAGRFVKQWQDSPGHRNNMLGRDYTQIGVGVARSRKTGRYYAVQVFAKPAPVPKEDGK
ncbi:MAG: CAP domain-containing protein [Phycisphaerae bacterium]|nr:CAP domain-containing protein [Phycisphaerae bacterium]